MYMDLGTDLGTEVRPPLTSPSPGTILARSWANSSCAPPTSAPPAPRKIWLPPMATHSRWPAGEVGYRRPWLGICMWAPGHIVCR